MDESWRVHVGSNLPRRKSTDPTPDFAKATRFLGTESATLDPSDFDDVFGGPPRSVFLRRYSGDFSTSVYDEIFRPAMDTDASSRKSRNPPVFRIPTAHRRSEGFYDDIFGAGEDRRSRSRSKSNSSSVLSSEDLSPLRPSGAEDGGFSSFASKLRPINIPSRQSSSSALSREQKRQTITSGVPGSTRSPFMDYHFTEIGSNDPFPKSHFGFSQHVSSPETIILEPSSYRSIKVTVDDLEIESPTSDISYGDHDPDIRSRNAEEKCLQEQEQEQGDGDLLGSYVIEIAAEKREEIDEAVAVEDAIAWVRERSQARKSGDSKQPNVMGIYMEEETETEQRVKIDQGMQVMMELQAHHPRRDFEKTQLFMAKLSEEFKRRETDEETQKPDKEMALESLEEDIKNWSAGKEDNIRSLLSTLQYILWPGSGWHAIPLTNMIETSQVRKAYQKARLCLHPDKLQQKGATIPQKYKAEKVFSLLQDAWATFNSQDVFSG